MTGLSAAPVSTASLAGRLSNGSFCLTAACPPKSRLAATRPNLSRLVFRTLCPEPAVQNGLAPVELNAIANPLADHLLDAIEEQAGKRPAAKRDDDAATELFI